MNKQAVAATKLVGWSYVIFGIVFVLIALDLVALGAGFGFALIDGAFGDKAGAAFWIDFLRHIPNVTKLIP